jgi:hypothetical protein
MDPRFAKNGQPGLNIGPINAFPKDRFGATIHPGCHVLYRPDVDVVYQVTEVKPILDPRAPQGAISVVLVGQVRLTLKAGTPWDRLIALNAGAPPEGADDEPVPPTITEN